MRINGKAIAADIVRETANAVSHLSHQPHAMIVTCAPNFETQKYLALKLKRAEEAGVALSVIEFAASSTTKELIASIERFTAMTDAIVVQLPLPEHIDTDAVVAAVPTKYDADGLHADKAQLSLLSPVVGAIAEIAERYHVPFAGRQVVVLGQGRLVGVPAALYARAAGAHVTVLTKESEDQAAAIAAADILILGAGVPNLVTPDMIREGVVIFDAGTSEANGVLAGDADPACADKAALITPVPGGIGPITIAVLLRNIVELAAAR